MANDTNLFEASTFDEALRVLDDVGAVDLVLIDLHQSRLAATTVLAAIGRRCPAAAVVVLSETASRKAILEALELGVAGCIPKQLSAQALLSALRLIIAGERYVPGVLLNAPAVPGRGLHAGAPERPETSLTRREREILDLLREGLPNKLIARRLNVSVVTVKSHLGHLFRKLGVQSRLQAVRSAVMAE